MKKKLEELQTEAEKRAARRAVRKRPRMKVSGKSVFGLKKIIEKKKKSK
ncbi:MAG: hypothetical protein ABIE68_03030 [bacterium]